MTETANKAMPKASRKEQDAADELRVTAINSIDGRRQGGMGRLRQSERTAFGGRRPC